MHLRELKFEDLKEKRIQKGIQDNKLQRLKLIKVTRYLESLSKKSTTLYDLDVQVIHS